jgi:hypothetical protein
MQQNIKQVQPYRITHIQINIHYLKTNFLHSVVFIITNVKINGITQNINYNTRAHTTPPPSFTVRGV